MTDTDHARAIHQAVEALNVALHAAARAGVQATLHMVICPGVDGGLAHPMVQLGRIYRIQGIDPGIGEG